MPNLGSKKTAAKITTNRRQAGCQRLDSWRDQALDFPNDSYEPNR